MVKKLLFFSSIILLSYAHAYDFDFINNKTNGILDQKFIQKLVEIFNVDIFFETGTFLGLTTLNAVNNFKELHTVELYELLFKNAKNMLAHYKNVSVYHGKSAEIIRNVACTLKGTVLFWLDAHFSGEGTALSSEDPNDPHAVTAIREELIAIKEASITNCVILIDDIRGFGTEIAGQKYIGCWGYPTLQEVYKDLLKINPNFEVALLGDMLLAYDGHCYKPKFSEAVIACTKTRLYDGYNLSDIQLREFEKKIMLASPHEKEYIESLYRQMTDYKDPMFWHDLWYALVEFGEGHYSEARRGFHKVKNRIQQRAENNRLIDQIIYYDHPRIDKYIALCNTSRIYLMKNQIFIERT